MVRLQCKSTFQKILSVCSTHNNPTKSGLCIKFGPVLLATAAKLGIRQERGTRDKPSQ